MSTAVYRGVFDGARLEEPKANDQAKGGLVLVNERTRLEAFATVAHRPVTMILAVILIFSGLQKTFELAAPSGPRPSPVAASIQAFAVVWEFILATLLFYCARIALVLTAGTFALFAIIATSLALKNAGSCGCFGRIDAKPSVMLVLDLVAVGFLVLLMTRSA